MQSLKPSEPISASLQDVPIQKPFDGIFGITGNNATGQSSLVPNINQGTSTADAVDALITYIEEGRTNNIIGVHTATTFPLTGTVTYDNGPDDNGIGATLTSTATIPLISGLNLEIGHRILIANEANAIHNGVYNVTSVSPATFSAVRTGENSPATYFNGTSFIVLGGSEVGKLYSVHFNDLVADGSYHIGYEAINFDVIPLSGAPAAGSSISGVEIFITALPAYDYTAPGTITADVNSVFPFAGY